MLTLSALAIATFIGLQDPARTSQPAPPQTGQTPTSRSNQRAMQDQTFQVTRGTRIDLLDCTGEVIVRTWARDTVQLRSNSRRADVSGTLKDKVLVITTSSSRGRDMDTVNYELTVPAWIDLHIEGHECGMEVDGVAGMVAVKNIEGDITLRGIDGSIDAQSIEGDIEITGGKGSIKASSSDADIRISNVSGAIDVDSVDGDIELTDVTSTNITASNVDGDVRFRGALQPTAKYHLETHDGDVTLVIPDKSNASLTMRQYDGELKSTHPLKATSEVRRGRRVTYTLGTGSGAQVEIETFDGDINIRKPGENAK